VAADEEGYGALQGELVAGGFAGAMPFALSLCEDCVKSCIQIAAFAQRGVFIQEIKMQEGDCSFLAADLKSLLDTAGRGKDEQAKESVKLEYLTGLVKDMFLDWQRFSGVTTSKSRLGQLTELLHDNASSCQQVIDFVLNTK